MFDHHIHFDPTAIDGPHFFDAVTSFIRANLGGLERAAERLAGRRGVQLVADIERAMADPSGAVPIADRVGELLDILELEHVHIKGSEEAARFSDIDPASREVEEICRLTDGLHRALDAAAADLRRSAAWRSPVRALAA